MEEDSSWEKLDLPLPVANKMPYRFCGRKAPCLLTLDLPGRRQRSNPPFQTIVMFAVLNLLCSRRINKQREVE